MIAAMLKGTASALFAFCFVTQADQYFSDGRYSAAVVALARSVARSLGI
jgi:hypothetical protein